MTASSIPVSPRNRIPVSLRLPESMVEAVSSYAKKHSLRKTDAYLHFLELGIASSSSESNERTLDQIRSQTAEILALLKHETAIEETSTETILSAIASIAKGYPAIEQAFLFGSFARGAQRSDSDVDVQLILDRSKRFNLRDLSRFSKQIEEATHRECDIVTADNLEDAEFAKNLEAERILAYERKKQ